MTFRVIGRALAIAATVVMGAYLSTTPADAAKGCRGKIKNGVCYAKKSTKQRVVVARNRLGDRQWHGWGASFHLDGRSYKGGNPQGPAMWYNNGEGGFHPTVFWVLYERYRP
jgi:hypothetical protein